MPKIGKAGAGQNSVKGQINRLLMTAYITTAVIIAVFSLMLISVNSRYEEALLCANTAADFNKEFKSTLDLEMYNHVIRPRTAHSVEELPMQELDSAEEVLHRLEETTSLPDNRWRIRSMLDMCRNLRSYMIEIAETDTYDMRMELLERNIRGETGLTLLIEQYMHDFIDDEVQQLARLRRSIGAQSTALIVTAVLVAVLFSLGMLIFSIRITRGITAPIGELSDKAEHLGSDQSYGKPVETDIEELRILDRNFDRMAERIRHLMAKQMEDQRSLHRAELELLQAQINPHFLYNTLDSIVILAESQREQDVVSMVTNLSTFFRNSLNGGRDIISLRAELVQATSYLEIQQVRYSDILDYSISVPEEMQDCMVPKLILQPLIENALYHGIKNRRGRGLIRITGEMDGEHILIRVSDNGAGMSEETLREMQKGVYHDHHSGLGLKNVHERIRLYCGEPFGLSFESTPGVGTVVSVRLPGPGEGFQDEEERNDEKDLAGLPASAADSPA